jgi:hypothetical protein
MPRKKAPPLDDLVEQDINVVKKEGTDASLSRMRMGEIGVPNLKISAGGWLETDLRKALTYPHNLKEYEKMRQDATVDTALNTAEVFLTKALVQGKYKTFSKNPLSIQFTEYLNWNQKNLVDQTWYDVVTNIISYLQYGFSWVEKVYEPNTKLKYSKFPWKIKKLAPRSQHSIAKLDFNDDNRTLKAIRQYPPQSLNQGVMQNSVVFSHDYPEIKRNKFMLFSFNSKNENPLGVSPLNACWRAWKEKTLVESYQTTGIAKGLG